MTSASPYGDLRHLLPNNYKTLITAWLEEDTPSFDYSGFVVGESEGEARLLGKSEVSIFYLRVLEEDRLRGVGCSSWCSVRQ